MSEYAFVSRSSWDGSPEVVATATIEGTKVSWSGPQAKKIIKDTQRQIFKLLPNGFDPKDPSHIAVLPNIYRGSYFWVVKRGSPVVERGGAGSGHHGHAGRPGEVGGSAPVGVAPLSEGIEYDWMPKSLDTLVPEVIEKHVERMNRWMEIDPKGLYITDSPTKAARTVVERYMERENLSWDEWIIDFNINKLRNQMNQDRVGGIFVPGSGVIYVNTKSYRQQRIGEFDLMRHIEHEYMHYVDDVYIKPQDPHITHGTNFALIMLSRGYPRKDWRDEYVANVLQIEFLERWPDGFNFHLSEGMYPYSDHDNRYHELDKSIDADREMLMDAVRQSQAEITRTFVAREKQKKLIIEKVPHLWRPDLFDEVLVRLE